MLSPQSAGDAVVVFVARDRGGAEVDYSRYVYRPKSRQADFEFGRDFLVTNQQRYLELFNHCRPVVMLVSVVCGWLIWRWSRALFGEIGGLISVWLWVFLPESLTHGMLLATDMGATCTGFLATCLFWRYLRAPSLERALVCGVALGVAEGTKFSCIVLPLVWVALAAFVRATASVSSENQLLRANKLPGLAVFDTLTESLRHGRLRSGVGRSNFKIGRGYTVTIDSRLTGHF